MAKKYGLDWGFWRFYGSIECQNEDWGLACAYCGGTSSLAILLICLIIDFNYGDSSMYYIDKFR